MIFTIIAILVFCFSIWLSIKADAPLFIPVLVVLGMAYLVLLNVTCDPYSQKSVTKLYSGYNGMEIHGTRRTINEVDTVYYWVNDNGVMSKKSAPMSESVFVEDGLEELWEVREGCKASAFHAKTETSISYEFHVPVGSVTSVYQYK